MSSSSQLGNVKIDRAKVIDCLVDNLTSATAKITNLVVDDLKVNNVEDATPDYDVIVVGGGIAAVSALIKLITELVNRGDYSKKIGLFLNSPEVTKLDFYKTLIYNPDNIPEEAERAIINDSLKIPDSDLERTRSTARSLYGGFYVTNNLGQRLENVYLQRQIIKNDKTAANPLGGLLDVRALGGLVNINGTVAVTASDSYVNNNLDLRSELDFVLEQFKLATKENILRNNNTSEDQIILVQTLDSALGNIQNHTVVEGGALVEDKYYNSCGRINLLEKLEELRSMYSNLVINYNSQVTSLDVLIKDGMNCANGVFVNYDSKFTANRIILSAGITGTATLLRSMNDEFPSPQKPLGNFTAKYQEIPPFNFLLTLPNLKEDKRGSSITNYNHAPFSITLTQNNRNSRFDSNTVETFWFKAFNMEVKQDVLQSATIFFGQGELFQDYEEFIAGPLAPAFSNLVGQIGQQRVLDSSWNGGYKPVGSFGVYLIIVYGASNLYESFHDSSSNSNFINNTKTDVELQGDSITSTKLPGSVNKTVKEPYETFKNALKTTVTHDYVKVLSGKEQQYNEYLNNIRKTLDDVLYGEFSIKFQMLNSFSRGLYPYTPPPLPPSQQIILWTAEASDLIPNQIGADVTQAPYSRDMTLEQFKQFNEVNGGEYTWHSTRCYDQFLNQNTYGFNNIKNLYAGDQGSVSFIATNSTSLLSASAAVRAAQGVVDSFN